MNNIIIADEKGTGKSSVLQRYTEQYPEKFSGVLTPVRNNRRYLFTVDDQKWIPLEAEDGNTVSIGRFSFRKEAFDTVLAHFSKAHSGQLKKIFIIDEIGPLELRGEGFAPLVRFCLKKDYKGYIFVLRKHFIREIVDKFALNHFEVMDITEFSSRVTE